MENTNYTNHGEIKPKKVNTKVQQNASKAYHERNKDSGRLVKADIPCSLGGGRRGFDPRQLRRKKRAFFPPLAI